MYLLDTNAVAALMKKHPNFIQHFYRELPENIAIPAVVWAEIQYGIYKNGSSKIKKFCDDLVKLIKILPLDQQVAEAFGKLKADNEKQGKNLSSFDMLIASFAYLYDAILITNDQAFYNIQYIQVEDWTK